MQYHFSITLCDFGQLEDNKPQKHATQRLEMRTMPTQH